jgi:hypothetical protein
LNKVGMQSLDLAINAQVVAPERTGAHNGDTQRKLMRWGHGYFFAAGAGASTASRQRA